MTEPTDSDRLADLAERYWRFECRETPVAAALAGVRTGDDVLFRESQDDYARRDRTAGEMLGELAAIRSAGLLPQQRATHRLLQRELSGIRAHYAVDAHLRPSLFPAGLDFTSVFVANSTTIDDAESAARHLARLQSIPAALADVRANLEAGRAKGFRYPRVVLDGAAANTRGLIAGPPDASPWYGPFRRSPAIRNASVRAVAQRALATIGDTLIPALAAYAEFLTGTLAAGSRDTIACTDDPRGHDFYRVLVRHFTTTDDTPEDVHALGLAEVARLETEIAEVAAQAGFAGDVAGYRAFLATDPRFVAPSKETLRASIESLCKRVDRLIPAFFGRIPRITYGVDSIPEAMSVKMPPAYAQPNPADRSAPGVFWVSSLPAKCPSYMHVPLVLHEGWPGHLMHIALLQEMDALPAFRRNGAVKYTACVEGWALYCETLGVEMGLYETPHQHYGRLEMEMWRAVRLVVDTGIHWHGWPRDRAIGYMAGRLALSRETIEGEVDRYAALPGQALGYQLGNLRMRSLRRRAEAALGERFKPRAFHEAVMTAGAVTLPVLDELIDDWLERQAAAG